jgi:hypothetical protein
MLPLRGRTNRRVEKIGSDLRGFVTAGIGLSAVGVNWASYLSAFWKESSNC